MMNGRGLVRFVFFLKIFYEATKKFSGSKFPTIHLFLPSVCKIHDKLVEKLHDVDSFTTNIARKMKAKIPPIRLCI